MIKNSDDSSQVQVRAVQTTTSTIPYKQYQSKTVMDVEQNPNSCNGSSSSRSSSSISSSKLSLDELNYNGNVSSDDVQDMADYYKFLRCLGGSKEFVCGWGAALVNIAITFPINKIIFRQMLHNVRVGGAYEQIKSEGFMFLYRGVLPPLLQKSVSTSLMFGMYENCRQPLASYHIPAALGNSVAAMLAGSFEALLTPFERLQTLLQDQCYHKEFKNTSHAMRIIHMEHGVKEFYRGFVPIVLRNGPSNVFFFGLRDYCNDRIPDSHLWYLAVMKQFMIGACIGTFISSVFYPLNVVKVHVQSRLGGPYQSVTAAFSQVFLERNRSLRGFYRGVYMNCTRAFISWGVINVSYEAIKKTVYGAS